MKINVTIVFRHLWIICWVVIKKVNERKIKTIDKRRRSLVNKELSSFWNALKREKLFSVSPTSKNVFKTVTTMVKMVFSNSLQIWSFKTASLEKKNRKNDCCYWPRISGDISFGRWLRDELSRYFTITTVILRSNINVFS